MRIWKGTEQEFGNKVKTLYIEGNMDLNVDIILSLAKKHKVSRLYFGAGNCVFTNFDVFAKLISLGYTNIFLETCNPSIIPVIYTYNITIIQRIKSTLPHNFHNSILKVETPYYVYTIPVSQMQQTVLNPQNYNPSKKIYKEDTIIYDSQSTGESVCPS